MSYTGSIPTASIWGTWSENVEIWSIDDDTLMDLTGVTEITMRLRKASGTFQFTVFDELTLTMSDGDITIPSTGIVQWRAEQSSMATLQPGLYEIILTLEDDTDVVPLILGPVSIVE